MVLVVSVCSGISSYVQNSLSDIITDLLKQATIQGYSNDIEAHPYQLAGSVFSIRVFHLYITFYFSM